MKVMAPSSGRMKRFLLSLVRVTLASIVGAIIALIAGAIAMTVWSEIRDHAAHARLQRKADCQNHLKQIGLALQNYLAAQGAFPPAYIVDADGQPMHSWRLLILPYLEGDEEQLAKNKSLYDAYRFDEPWDGPNNAKLIEQMPNVFGCPSDEGRTKSSASYVAIVGDPTMWPFWQEVSPQQVTDGLSNTMIVVETKGPPIPWTSPRDLEFDKLDFVVNSFSGYGLISEHRQSANVLMADGAVRTLTNSTPAEMVRAMATRDGGEIVILP